MVPISGAGNSSGSGTPAADGGTGEPPSTDPTTISTCRPGPCTADSDCAVGMVCHATTLTTCSAGETPPPCAPNTKCDTSGSADPVCTSQTVSSCTFKWALPCNADSDCGDGFSCQPLVTISCSGSGSAPGVGGETGGASTGSAGPVELVADSCTSSTSYPGSCRPLAVTCNTNGDCPSNWICQDNTSIVATPGTGGMVGGGGTAGTSSTGAGAAEGSGSGVISGPADVAPPAFSRSCVAPYWAEPAAGEGGRSGSSPSSPGTTAGGQNDGSTGGENDGTPPMTTGAGHDPSGGSTGTLQPTAGAGSGGSTGEAAGKASTDNSGGCAVIPAGGSPDGLLAGLGLGLALLVARRRRC